MSRNYQLRLLYAAENQDAADIIRTDLSFLGYAVSGTALNDPTPTPLANYSQETEGTVLLLVTDNFLRSRSAMVDALAAVKTWSAAGRLFPIIADGHRPAENGRPSPVPTSFDRVSHVIAYMNHWQDEYLRLRKDIRQEPHSDDTARWIDVIKLAAAETGEFLRLLRTLPHHPFPALREDNYLALRSFLGDNRPVNVLPPSGPDTQPRKSLEELIRESSEELIAENETPTQASETAAQQAGSETAASPPPPAEDLRDLTEPEREPDADEPDDLDDDSAEDDLLDEILSEVLQEEAEGISYTDTDDLQFVGEDPEDPSAFDLDTLFEEEEQEPGETGMTGRHVVELDLVDAAEGTLLLLPDEQGQATAHEIMEHALNHFDGEELAEGLDYLRKCIDLNQDDLTLRYYFAFALARYGEDFESARRCLNEILETDPGHADAWFLLGEMAHTEGNHVLARRCLERVATIMPAFPDVHFRLGQLLQHHFPGETAAAADHFRRAVEQDAKHAEAFYQLASLELDALGDISSAIRHFRAVLRLDPVHPFANYDLALVYHRLHDHAKASEFYERSIRINPELRTPENDKAFLEPAANAELMPTNQNGSVLTPTALAISHSIRQALELTPQPLPAALVPQGADAQPEGMPMPGPMKTRIPDPKPESITPAGFHLADSPPAAGKPVVLLTGATAGIGRATALALAREGFPLVVTGRRPDRLAQLRSDIRAAGGADICTLPFDVRHPEAVSQWLDRLPEAWRAIGILINNAGLSRGLSPIFEGDPEHWDTMIDTNVKGLLYITRAVTPGMVARRNGHIINVASTAGKEAYPAGNVYCASKAAVDMLTKAMRLDLYQHQVRVSQIAPGHVEETEFASVRFDGDTERAARTYDGFQPLKASDVADIILFIVTRPAHVNVQDLVVFGTQQAGSNFIDRSGR